MIINVDENNIIEAAKIHSESWKDSHKEFCNKDFIEQHTIKHQKEYLIREIEAGKEIFMLVDNKAIGIVSIYNNLIENLYVLPNEQQKGYGTQLLKFAMKHCNFNPTLWVLNNNQKAYSLYLKLGFRKIGEPKRLSETISEIKMVYKACE